jgi:hypothetical protein
MYSTLQADRLHLEVGDRVLAVETDRGILLTPFDKRIAFLALVTCLGVNGKEFDASEEGVVATILALAERSLSEAQLARWIGKHIAP